MECYSDSVATKLLGLSQEKSSITQASLFLFFQAFSHHPVFDRLQYASDHRLDGGEGLGTIRPQLIQVFFLDRLFVVLASFLGFQRYESPGGYVAMDSFPDGGYVAMDSFSDLPTVHFTCCKHSNGGYCGNSLLNV